MMQIADDCHQGLQSAEAMACSRDSDCGLNSMVCRLVKNNWHCGWYCQAWKKWITWKYLKFKVSHCRSWRLVRLQVTVFYLYQITIQIFKCWKVPMIYIHNHNFNETSFPHCTLCFPRQTNSSCLKSNQFWGSGAFSHFFFFKVVIWLALFKKLFFVFFRHLRLQVCSSHSGCLMILRQWKCLKWYLHDFSLEITLLRPQCVAVCTWRSGVFLTKGRFIKKLNTSIFYRIRYVVYIIFLSIQI